MHSISALAAVVLFALVSGGGAHGPQEPAPRPASRVPKAPPAERAAELARLRGRFVFPGGLAAVGVQVRMHGWQANQERVIEHGLPERWQDPRATTDAEGRIEIELDPPRAFQFTLDAKLAGYAPASWRWSEIAPGEVKDLGTVELVAGGAVRARMEDAGGAPIASGWTVYASAVGPNRAEGREPSRGSAALDPASGAALLSDLPPGPVKLTAYSRVSNWIDGPTVEVQAGREVEALIRYAGPDESRRIVVVVFTAPFHVLRVDEESIHLTGSGIEPGRSRMIAGSSQSYAFDALAPGAYSVSIDDPRFEPWVRHGVEPGTRVDAKLRGSAAVRLGVVDARTGEAIPRYDLRLRFANSQSWPNEFQLLAPGKEPPPGGLFAGLPAVASTLWIAVEGLSPLELPLADLAPGETRALTAKLSRGATLRGSVRGSDGAQPVAGAQVQLVPSGAPARAVRRGWISTEAEAPPIVGETDAAGRFEITGLPAGRFAVHALAHRWLVATIDPLELAEGEQRELDLALPPSGALRGRLVAPEGAPLAGVRLELRPAQRPVVEDLFGADGLELAPRADGRFESGPLPPGGASLWIRGPDVSLPSGFGGSFGAPVPERQVAELELVAGPPQEIELDLRERWFGGLRVRVTREGAPLAGHVVEARSNDASEGASSGAVTGSDGWASIPFLFDGDWRVSVRPVEGEWTAAAARPVRVLAGRESDCAIDVLLVAGELRLVERANGQPLREKQVLLGPLDGPQRAFTTDAEGRLALELAPGSYALSAAGAFPLGPQVQLEWSASGPAGATVELELPDEDG